MKDLDSLLREDAAHPLPADAFLARVMQALPPPRAPRRWLRPLLVMGSAIAGSALAVAFAPATESPTLAVAEWIGLGSIAALSSAAVTSLAIGGVLLASAVVVALDTD